MRRTYKDYLNLGKYAHGYGILWMGRRAAYTALAFIMAAISFAAEPSPMELRPGQYVMEDGVGSLSINAASAGQQSFRISVEGANRSTCDVSGKIEAGKANVTLPATEHILVCKIDFQDAGDVVSVKIRESSPEWQQCRNALCGLRATFEGRYLAVPQECTSSVRRDTEVRFTHLMRAKRYQQAYDTLSAVQSQCTRFLGPVEIDEVHNDLATALHRLDRDQKCLDELKSTQGAAADNLAELKKRYVGLPDDLERYLPVAQTTWRLQELCHRTRGPGG